MAQSSGSDRHTTAINGNTDCVQGEQSALARSQAARQHARVVPETVRQIRALLTSGLQARKKLSAGLQNILHGSNNRESEGLKELLDDIAHFATEFAVDESAFKAGRRLLTRVFGEKLSTGFCAQCATVRDQANSMSTALERCQQQLLQDIARLERSYQENLECYLRLESYVDAGQEKLHQLNEALAPAEGSAASAAADRLRVAQRTDLEEELRNLRRALDDAMPILSSLRLYQDSQKALVNKIHTTMTDDLWRWREQLTRAIDVLGGAPSAAKEPAPQRNIDDAAAVKDAQLALISGIKETQLVAENANRRREDTSDQLQRWRKRLLTSDAGRQHG